MPTLPSTDARGRVGGRSTNMPRVVGDPRSARRPMTPGAAERPRLRRFQGRLADRLWAEGVTPVDGCVPVAISGAVGGCGASTLAAAVGMVAAAASTGRVAAVDLTATLTSGLRLATLAEPAGLTTGNLLDALNRSPQAAGIDDCIGRSVTGLHVFADHHGVPAPASQVELPLAALAEVLPNRYVAAVLDLPALPDSNVLSAADLGANLVIATRADRSALEAACAGLEFLRRHGRSGGADEAVIAVSGVSRSGPRDIRAALRTLRSRCRCVVEIPFDRGLGERPMNLDAIKPATSAALMELTTATVLHL